VLATGLGVPPDGVALGLAGDALTGAPGGTVGGRATLGGELATWQPVTPSMAAAASTRARPRSIEG
jgi:hypothetical protein